ncbi:VanZ family protein [Microbacterium sp. P06]|uniref:VanZ family protein n=1 Tax=Microbacterium sp. P06 TaxID=3366949 RepID=UPI003745EF8C
MTTTTTRSIRLLAAFLAVAAVALLTLAPRFVVAPARGHFMRLMDAVTAPLLAGIPYGDAERMLNAAMFVPLGATIALLLARRFWPVAIFAGFALSATVEYVQASIPGRVPDPNDVLWNTLGGAAGVIVVTAARWAIAAAQRQSPPPQTSPRRPPH